QCTFNAGDGPQSLIVVPESTGSVPNHKKAEIEMLAVQCVANCALLESKRWRAETSCSLDFTPEEQNHLGLPVRDCALACGIAPFWGGPPSCSNERLVTIPSKGRIA